MHTNEQKQIAYLNLLLTSWLMLGQIDALRDTQVYKHKLKNLLNQVAPELEKMINTDLDILWGVDDPAMYNLMEHFKQFLYHMATLRPEYIAGLGELLGQWRQHPELTLHRNGIKIIREPQAA